MTVKSMLHRLTTHGPVAATESATVPLGSGVQGVSSGSPYHVSGVRRYASSPEGKPVRARPEALVLSRLSDASSDGRGAIAEGKVIRVEQDDSPKSIMDLLNLDAPSPPSSRSSSPRWSPDYKRSRAVRVFPPSPSHARPPPSMDEVVALMKRINTSQSPRS